MYFNNEYYPNERSIAK